MDISYASREVYEYIAATNTDPIVERRTCRISGSEFPIFQSDLDFFQKVSPIIGGKQFSIPLPTLCPEERQRRRLSFRNERKLYRRVCDASGRDIISVYSPDKQFPVYDINYRRSDKRNPLDYGIHFDPNLSFAQQYQSLMNTVPKYSLIKEFTSQVNSDYTNSAGRGKNCYMAFEMGDCEDVYFSEHTFFTKSCIDITHTNNSEHCYECVDCYDSINLSYSVSCTASKFSAFLYNCTNCDHCFLCYNLVNAQYCIRNTQYPSKSEYEKALQTLGKDYTVIQKEFQTMIESDSCVRPALQGIQNEAVYGSNTTQSKNAVFVHDSFEVRDCKYSSMINSAQDCMDYDSRGENSSLVYEVEESGRNISNVAFCYLVRENCKNIYYSAYCTNCSDCFACVGLRNKQYCIFNTQYTKEEYEQKIEQVIQKMIETGERGEFFHPSLSPFGYNETVAMEYYPATSYELLGTSNDLISNNKQLITYGYHRSDYQAPSPQATKVLKCHELPCIEEVTDDILMQAIQCKESGKLFRLIKPELDFYRKHALALPSLHPDVRYQHRLESRVPRQLYLRSCDKTHQTILSTYPSTTPYKVYSQEAYQQFVYG